MPNWLKVLLLTFPIWMGAILLMLPSRIKPRGLFVDQTWKGSEIFLALIFVYVSHKGLLIIDANYVRLFDTFWKRIMTNFFFLDLCYILFVYYIVSYRNRLSFKVFGISLDNKHYILLTFQYFLLIIGTLILAEHFFSSHGWTPYTGARAEELRQYTVTQFIGFSVLSILIGSISEELFYRGLLLGYFMRKLGYIGGIIGVSLVFTYVHLYNFDRDIVGLIGIFMYGLIFSYAYYKTQSLTFAISIHASINFWVASTYIFVKLKDQGINFNDYALLVAAVTFGLWGLTYYLQKNYKVFQKKPTSERPISQMDSPSLIGKDGIATDS